MLRRRFNSTMAILATSGGFAAVAQPAAAIDVGGIKFPTTVAVAGSRLVLNGAGLRYKFIVRVYAAGLYLATKAQTTEAVLTEPGPKRMHVVMLRDIDATELGKLFVRGMEDNSPRSEFSKSIPGTLRMAELFSTRKHLNAGESFGMDWIPGAGTVIRINDQVQGEPIREPEFFQALLRIWLGPSPADRRLKEALLGIAPHSTPTQ